MPSGSLHRSSRLSAVLAAMLAIATAQAEALHVSDGACVDVITERSKTGERQALPIRDLDRERREVQRDEADFDFELFKECELPNFLELPNFKHLRVPVFRSLGRRGPGILLVHGNSSSSRSFVFQIFSSFGLTHRIFLLDLPGHGRAEKVDPSLPLPTDAAGIPVGFPEYQIGLLEALAVVAADPEIAPEVFVGWSLGGDLLLQARGAGFLPDAKGFFIFGTAPVGAHPPTTEPLFLPPNVPERPLGILPSFGFAFQVNPQSALGFTLNGEFTDPVPPFAPPPISAARNVGEAYLREFFGGVRRLQGIVPRFFLEDGFDRADARARASLGVVALGLLAPGALPLPDELEVLQNLAGDPSTRDDDIPIAVAFGAQEAFVNGQYLQDLAAAGAIPTLWRDEIIEVRGAGHAIHFERPARLNSLISEFARDLRP
ncbi:MAG: alpha/beta fold hydrolase [Gammaproteobacteria bacterium]